MEESAVNRAPASRLIVPRAQISEPVVDDTFSNVFENEATPGVLAAESSLNDTPPNNRPLKIEESPLVVTNPEEIVSVAAVSLVM